MKNKFEDTMRDIVNNKTLMSYTRLDNRVLYELIEQEAIEFGK